MTTFQKIVAAATAAAIEATAHYSFRGQRTHLWVRPCTLPSDRTPLEERRPSEIAFGPQAPEVTDDNPLGWHLVDAKRFAGATNDFGWVANTATSCVVGELLRDQRIMSVECRIHRLHAPPVVIPDREAPFVDVQYVTDHDGVRRRLSRAVRVF